ncbi:MAG: ATP-binding protein, partial [Phaeodactylibacter sp.]|nr:ATP-binding protein [Phaeodactylibacter sp.]
ATSLDDLKGLVYKPSDDLILALAWAQLNLPNPNIHDVKQALRELAQPDTKELQPAAEVKSMLQVRTAFESLTAAGEINKAVNYMETIVETRNRERQSKIALDLSNHEVGQSIGLEFIARICLVQALHLLNDRVGAIEELAEIETLLRDNDQFLAPGFLVQNWKELALTAEKIGLLNAAFKYVESGLVIEPENSDLLAYKERLSETLLQQDKDGLMQGLSGLGEKIRSGESAAEIRKVSDTLRPFAPNLMEVFSTLAMNMDDDADKAPVEDMLDQVNFLARMELPAEACREVERLLDWIIINKGWDAVRIPVEIDVYGEQIWPRMDNNQEGTCLLAFSSRQEIENVVLKDPTTEKEIWSGALQPNDVQYKRWTFFREDGFSSDIPLDLPLLLYARDTSGERTYPTAVNVLVGSGEPIWPTYPTGALSPEDVHGAELYGRAYLISRIIRSLGRHRAQSTFFLQGPRQMGKTSLLNFAINQAPAHVLPVYVNLEKQWSSKEPGNIWNYLVNRVQEESSGKAVSPAVSGNDEASLINMVAETCERQQKDYVLFLIDELHFLFEKCDNPSNVLASFRDFLNIRDNRIALLLSDRYTRDELEKRCPSEYWAQLTLLEVGPLDAESTSRAIEYPTRGTDITFLPKTIQQLFHLTGGYPYHLQRAAQYILDNMYSGPWLTALPEDVEEIITHFLEQDLLFQSGLCRPDRIDDELAEAIAALLEWIDLQELLPVLADSDSEWGKSLMRWNPTAGSFLAHMRNPERIITRLRNIGVMKEREDAFFSPLLQMWLQKMRRQSRGLRGDKDTAQWQFISESDGGNLSGRDWQRLDSELIKRAAYKGKPPLKEKNTHIDDWETMTRKVSSEADFRMFVDAAFRLIVDKREERSSIQKYPWLFLAYHRLRLVRNYIAHESETRSALNAWNETCRRALGGNRSAYMPATPDEWQALQLTMLRSLYAGMNNALEIASKAE